MESSREICDAALSAFEDLCLQVVTPLADKKTVLVSVFVSVMEGQLGLDKEDGPQLRYRAMVILYEGVCWRK